MPPAGTVVVPKVEPNVNPVPVTEIGPVNVKLAAEIGFKRIISVELEERLQERNRELFENEIKSGQVELLVGEMQDVNTALNYAKQYFDNLGYNTEIDG